METLDLHCQLILEEYREQLPRFEKARQDGFVLIDIGGGEFDHHQPEARKDTYANGVIKSSLGHILDRAVSDEILTAEELEILLFNGIYALQAHDNGQGFNGVPSPFWFVSHLNSDDPADDEAQFAAFNEAVGMAAKVLRSMVNNARKIGPEHIECVAAFEAMGDDCVADFPHHMKNSVQECQLWNEEHPEKKVRFFTFPSLRGGFMVQGVNRIGSFVLDHSLPFKGLHDEELNRAAGITDGIFVHANGFLGSTESLASCHILANLAE